MKKRIARMKVELQKLNGTYYCDDKTHLHDDWLRGDP